MIRRQRDYKAEYAKRIARGLNGGLTRSQARGHPKAAEPPIRNKSAVPFTRELEEGLREVKRGKSLTESARAVHVSPERLRRYLASSGIAEKKGRRWVIGEDKRSREMLLYSNGEAVTVKVSPEEAERIGRYTSAVGHFLSTNDPAFLAPFEGQSVTDTAKRRYPFETDPNALYRLAETGSSSFEDIYRIVI